MTLDLVRTRLHNQFLSQTDLTEPEQVVRRFGAVQAQDFAGATWALGLRMLAATETAIERDFNAGKILRTHILRPTWHFVRPDDIRWMQALTAPRVHAANAFMYRQLELDRPLIRKSYRVLEMALHGGRHLTRPELGAELAKAGVQAAGQRLSYIVMSAELDALICSGPRRGKQFTYALTEERAPAARRLGPDEALAELARRYFATRGPATLQDFTWWSGLTMAQARQGVESLTSELGSESIDGKTYWFEPSSRPRHQGSPRLHLLPNYDEYFIGFRDRRAIGKFVSPLHPQADAIALNAHVVIVDGQVAGGWRRTLRKNAVTLELNLLVKAAAATKRKLVEAAARYGDFLGLPVELVGA